jgi:hypothetical protein
MGKSASQPALIGAALSFQACKPGLAAAHGQAGQAQGKSSHAYLVQVHSDAMSQVLEAVMPMLDRVLAHKTSEVREQKLEELWTSSPARWWCPARLTARWRSAWRRDTPVS